MKKDWKTTSAGIFATLLMVAGIFMPETMDESTQELTRTAFSNVVLVVGSIINVVNSIKAKDPK